MNPLKVWIENGFANLDKRALTSTIAAEWAKFYSPAQRSIILDDSQPSIVNLARLALAFDVPVEQPFLVHAYFVSMKNKSDTKPN